MIQGHGDDIYQSNQQIEINFSTNVWYGADKKAIIALVEKYAAEVFHYPQPDAGSFVKAAADYHGLQPANVIAGNGATELFYLVAHAFSGCRTLLVVPSFAEYEDACSLYCHRLEYAEDRESVKNAGDTELLFIGNPNNPDGKIWSLEQLEFLLKRQPNRVLVVDESFIHFAPEVDSASVLLKRYENLLIIRSMTKSYAIPGLRLGYMLGAAALMEKIRKFCQPWSVNALAIRIGEYLLREGDHLLPDAVRLLERQHHFSQQMACIPGFYPQFSRTSFFLTYTFYDTLLLKQYLREEHRILIRDASNFRGLDRHYFRVNTLTEYENEKLIKVLKLYAG